MKNDTEQLLKRYNDLVTSYFLNSKHINILSVALDSWSKSKDKNKEQYINRLTLRIQSYENKLKELTTEIQTLERTLKQRHVKIKPFVKKKL